MRVIEYAGMKFSDQTEFEVKDIVLELQDSWSSLLVPALKQSVTVFDNSYEFKSQEVKDWNDYFVKNSNIRGNVGNVFQIAMMLTSKFDIDGFCSRFLSNFKGGIDVDSLTIRDVALVNRLIAIQFFVEYTTRFLHFVTIKESNEYPANSGLSAYGLTKPQIEWLEKRQGEYADTIRFMTRSVNDIYDEVDKEPTTYVSQVASKGANGKGGIYSDIRLAIKVVLAVGALLTASVVVAQSIYWRMSGGKALAIAKKLQQQQNLRKALEARLANLRNLQEGNQSASLERSIQLTEDRLRKIDKELDDMGKRYDK